MRRAAKDGAGAVAHQHKVGDHHRQLPVRIEGMRRGQAGVAAQLLGLFDFGFGGAGLAAFLDEVGQLAVLQRQLPGQRMFRRQRHEGRAEQGVGPRGEDIQPGVVRQRKLELQTFAAADPVALHGAHFFRPAVQRIQPGQQFIGELGDAEEPLAQLAPFHHRAAAPALAVNHLFVGEHGHVHRVPVHIGFAAIDETGFVELQEQLLLLVVIVRIAGGELAAPVNAQSHHLELFAHRRDVFVGPVARTHALVARRILGRQAERIPAHGVQHIEALGAAEAGDDIAHGIVAGVPHMDAPRRIGEHLQHIGFGFVGMRRRLEQGARVPFLLPAAFRVLGVVTRHVFRPQPWPRLARRSSRARVRMESSSLCAVSGLGVASVQVEPLRIWRNTTTFRPSARKVRSMM